MGESSTDIRPASALPVRDSQTWDAAAMKRGHKWEESGAFSEAGAGSGAQTVQGTQQEEASSLSSSVGHFHLGFPAVLEGASPSSKGSMYSLMRT